MDIFLRSTIYLLIILSFSTILHPHVLTAEILAMVPYESKPAETLKSFKLNRKEDRREGIFIIDVDPKAKTFGRILIDIPLPSELGVHQIFYDRAMDKAYVTLRGKSELIIFKLGHFPYRLNRLKLPNCEMGQNIAFSSNNQTWYLTCLMSEKIIVGDVSTDKIKKTINLPSSYPHGIIVMSDINRILVTSSVSGDFSDKSDFFYVIQSETGKILSQHKLSSQSSKSGASPVGLLRVPDLIPPTVYITNMHGHDAWAAVWKKDKMIFDISKMIDFQRLSSKTPLNLYFNSSSKKLFVTSANPGNLHIFDVSKNPIQPAIITSLPAAEGANHAAFSRDGHYAFVQNSLLSLPGMSDGSITIIDLKNQNIARSVTTLKEMGLNPNSIILLPDWHNFAGH